MRVLIVDDERKMTESLADFLGLEKIEARGVGTAEEGVRKLQDENYDAVVTDLRMPGMGGLGLLRWIREEGRAVPVIMISAHGEVRDAVEAMHLGAYDYLVKPFDPEELVIRLRKAVAERRSRGYIEAGKRKAQGEGGLVGESPAMKELKRLVDRAAPAASTILLTGESGTGKEVAARLIHEHSGREGPFVPVNIGALPESLMESELFGHEKGAFTGADARRAGLFETAQGGTLFLDEIGELPLHLQVKLLRAIQEKKVVRLGSSVSIPVDVRLVAATNRDLETEVREGRFREDLYYRLNVIRIKLPPLREREGDKALLAGYFLEKLSKELGRRMEAFSEEALARIEAYRFPGNVRELENAVERAIILAEGPILGAADFQFATLRDELSARDGGAVEPFALAGKSLAEVERSVIAASLERNRYHREKTAAELGITRRTLLNKIKEYEIPVPNRDEG